MASRRSHVVPFPLERARRGERSEQPTLAELEQEMRELRQTYIRWWDDPLAVLHRLMELMDEPGPQAFEILAISSTICVAACEVFQGRL